MVDTEMQVEAGQLLWTPPEVVDTSTVMGRFIAWLKEHRDLEFGNYDALWEWSTTELEGFWGSLAEFLEIPFATPATSVLSERVMPGAKWFDGATLNYVSTALRGPEEQETLISVSQTRPTMVLTRADLRREVGRARAGLLRLGIGAGDRVAGYLPNIAETVIAFLATASIGAIFSSCAPELGTRGVLDRFTQIAPKVLIGIDGYRFGDKTFDRRAELDQIRHALPSVEAAVVVPYLFPEEEIEPSYLSWAQLTSDADDQDADVIADQVAFDHPLYILFSSGTTGLPKAIVHGHGGIILEHLKWLHLHADLDAGDRYFMHSTTGWMAWNLSVSALLSGAGLVIFDGDPTAPDWGTLWRLVGEHAITHFGISAPFLLACRRAGVEPRREADLSRLRNITSSGAPLPPKGYVWVYEQMGTNIQLASASGGTDICSAFVGMNPLVPVYAGEMSRAFLGAKVEAWAGDGHPVVGQEAELVLTAPMPSMPLYFWGDPTGERYRRTYFDWYPGVWRHGDWVTVTPRGTFVITGRSDATLNRGGVRLGTAEFYSVLDDIDGIADSLVIHIEDEEDGMGELILFVALDADTPLDEELCERVRSKLRSSLSPRHVPNQIVEVPQIPRNISGKRLEVPVKRFLTGDVQPRALAGVQPETLAAIGAAWPR